MYMNFKSRMTWYKDKDFEFRRTFVWYVPFLNHMGPIIDDIVYLLSTQRYDPGSYIVEYGDVEQKLYFVKQGFVNVTVPDGEGGELLFEKLPPGSCFCIYAAFSPEMQ